MRRGDDGIEPAIELEEVGPVGGEYLELGGIGEIEAARHACQQQSE